MKVLLFGYGSIGQRHAANLKALRPDVELVISDPPAGYVLDTQADDASAMPDAAIIASPTAKHADHMGLCWDWKINFYVEKPMWRAPQYNHAFNFNTGERCAVGHQYRFHLAMPAIREAAARAGVLHFKATDDLIGRYGPDVDGIMAAHPIDTALWLLGPAVEVALLSNGVLFTGEIRHERGISTHEYRMDAGPRASSVMTGSAYHPTLIDLPPNNEMYLDALRAWLEWVEGGARDERTATLKQGLQVMNVLAQVKRVQHA